MSKSLSKASTKRVENVQQMIAWNRKHVSETNVIDKANLLQRCNEITKQSKAFLVSLNRAEEPFRKSLVKLRSYQFCLATHGRHPGVPAKELIYGRYEGLTMPDLRMEMIQTQKDSTPSACRLRLVQKQLNYGKFTGEIIDQVTVRKKMDEILQPKPYEKPEKPKVHVARKTFSNFVVD